MTRIRNALLWKFFVSPLLVVFAISLLFSKDGYCSWIRFQSPNAPHAVWIYDFTQQTSVQKGLKAEEPDVYNLLTSSRSHAKPYLASSPEELGAQTFTPHPEIPHETFLGLTPVKFFKDFPTNGSSVEFSRLSYLLDTYKTRDFVQAAHENSPARVAAFLKEFLARITPEMIQEFPQVGFQASKAVEIIQRLFPEDRNWKKVVSDIQDSWHRYHFPMLICMHHAPSRLSKDTARFKIYIERYFDVTGYTSEFQHLYKLSADEMIVFLTQLLSEYPENKHLKSKVLSTLHQDNRHAEFVAKFDEFYRSSLASSSLKGARYFFATYIKALKELHQTERMGDAAKFAFQSLKVDYYTAREIITAIQAEPSLNSVRRELGELWISRIIPKLSDIGSDDYWAAYEISVQAGSERSLIEYLESELKKLNSAQSNLKSAALEILSYAHGRVGDRDLQLKDLDALLSDLPAGGDKETQLRRQRFQILKLLVVSQKKDLREANELAGILLQEFEKAFEARHQEFIYKNSAEYHALKHQQMLEMLHRESQRPERSFEEMEAAFEAKDSVRKLEMARERFVRKEGFPKISLEGNWLLMLAAYPKLQQFSHPLWITLSKKVTEGKFLEAMNLSWDYQERANYKSESLDSPRALENLKYAYQQGPKALGLLGFSLRDFFL